MTQPSVTAAAWGFHDLEGAMEHLVADGTLTIPFYPGQSRHPLITHDANRFITRRRLEYEIPPHLYKRLFQDTFAGFMGNASRQDSYLGTHTDYPSALMWFQQTAALIYDEYMRHGVILTILGSWPHEIVDYMMFAVSRMLGIRTVLTLPAFIFDPKDASFFAVEDVAEYALYKGRPRVSPRRDPAGLVEEQRNASYKAIQPIIKEEREKIRRRLLETKFGYRRQNAFLMAEYDRMAAEIVQPDFSPAEAAYVYFPLHYQPEAATMGACDMVYEDQIFAIETIARRLPPGFYLVVKEQPFQCFYNRPPLFFERLLRLDNVVVVATETSPLELIEHARCVVTINGSAAWEGLSRGKPVIYFGHHLCRQMPGAFEFSENLDMEAVLNTTVDRRELGEAMSDLYAAAYHGSIFSYLPNAFTAANLAAVADGVRGKIAEIFAAAPDYRSTMAATMAAAAARSRIPVHPRPANWQAGRLLESMHPLASPVRLTGGIYRSALSPRDEEDI